jgi:hypothetical protein
MRAARCCYSTSRRRSRPVAARSANSSPGPGPNGVDDIQQVFVDMFRDELRAERPDDELTCVAIVDEEPQKQYLSPEFELFREMFESHGIEAMIADPRDFVLQDNTSRAALPCLRRAHGPMRCMPISAT